MKQRGFTLIEILFVITLIGVMLAVALPRLGDAVSKQRVRSARDALVTLHAKARALAVQEGTFVEMQLVSPKVRLCAGRPTCQPRDSTDLQARYGTTFTATNTNVSFDPRGIGRSAAAVVTITNGTDTATVEFGAFGRVLR